jgi:hypothetical protein
MKTVLVITATILAILVSPIVMRHMCGLTSWPLEWAVALVAAVLPVILFRLSKKRCHWWAIVVIAPVLSLTANLLLAELLHWKKCPRVLYDSDGKAWIDSMQKIQNEPNQALEPTTTAVTNRAGARFAPAVVVAHL